MGCDDEDPTEVRIAVTNLDSKWERTHHYQPTKEEAKNLEAALAEARAAIEGRSTSAVQVHTELEDKSGHSPSLGNKGGEFGEVKSDSVKRPYKGGEQVCIYQIKSSMSYRANATPPPYLGFEAKYKACQVNCEQGYWSSQGKGCD